MTKKQPPKRINTRAKTFTLADTIAEETDLEPVIAESPDPTTELINKQPAPEAPQKPLTTKQQRFVEEYLIDSNGKQAAIRAGYSAKTAQEQGSRMLSIVKVKAEIEKGQAVLSEKSMVTAEYIIDSTRRALEVCQGRIPMVDKLGDPVLIEGPDGTLVQGYRLVNAQAAFKALDQLSRYLGLYDKDNRQRAGAGVVNQIQITFKDGDLVVS